MLAIFVLRVLSCVVYHKQGYLCWIGCNISRNFLFSIVISYHSIQFEAVGGQIYAARGEG
jgi:hypothetical protein